MRSWLVVVSCVFALACSDDKKNDQPKDVYEATLWPSTAELANDTLGGMDTETGDGRLHWNATPAQLVDVQPGRVLIAGQSRATPNGLMRFVTAVSTEGGGLTLTTINAPLQLAFKKLHVEAGERTATLDGNTVTSAAPGTLTPAVRSASGGGSLPLDFVAYDGDGNDATTDDQVYVNGNIGAVYDYTLGIDVDWGAVAEIPAQVLDCALSGFSECSVEDLMPEAAVGFFVSANADATATLGGAPFLAYEKEVPIFSATLSAFAIGPLVFFPEVTVTGHLTGKASSAFTVGAGAHAGFEGGLEFSTKTGPKSTPPTPFATFDTPTAEVALSAEASVGVEARIRVALYKVMGPYAGLNAYARVTADQEASPCWSVDTGIDGFFGVDIGVDLGSMGYAELAKAELPVNLANETIASGSCSLPPGSSSLPVGAGPDAEHLVNPTFTPFATFHQPTGYDTDDHRPPYIGYVNYVSMGTHRTYRARTIDGAFVVAGIDSFAVTKVRDDGTAAWATQYFFPEDGGYEQRSVSGIASLGDTTILVATKPYGLLRLNQDGSLVSAITYDIPNAPDDSPHGSDNGEQFYDLLPDGSGGVYLVGTHTDAVGATRSRLWVMRMAVDGTVLWSKRFGSGETEGYFPSFAIADAAGVVIAGNGVPGSGEHPAFLLRLAANDGSTVYRRRYEVSCAGGFASDTFHALGGTFTQNGSLILSGSASDAGISLRMRVDATGTASGFVAEEREDELNGTIIYTDIAELPTGGFVGVGFASVGSYLDGLVVSRLDAGLASSSRYITKLSYFSMAEPRLTLTDDGGAFIVDSVASEYDPTPGDPDAYRDGGIFAAKLPAKDSVASWRPDQVTAHGFTTALTSCTVTQSAWGPAIGNFTATAHASEVERSTFDQTPTGLLE